MVNNFSFILFIQTHRMDSECWKTRSFTLININLQHHPNDIDWLLPFKRSLGVKGKTSCALRVTPQYWQCWSYKNCKQTTSFVCSFRLVKAITRCILWNISWSRLFSFCKHRKMYLRTPIQPLTTRRRLSATMQPYLTTPTPSYQTRRNI